MYLSAWCFPGGSVVQYSCQCRGCRFDPWVRKIPWRRKWQPTPVFLPGQFHGQRSLVGCSPWGCKRVGHNLVTKQQQVTNNIKPDLDVSTPLPSRKKRRKHLLVLFLKIPEVKLQACPDGSMNIMKT